ncbi:MAG: DUF6682 family protein, partial [Vicinamibacterales bacterium]
MANPALLGSIAADVRTRLDEASASFWSNDEIRRWINEACRDIARRAEVLPKLSTIAALAAVRAYTLPTDAIRIYRAEFIPTGQTNIYPLQYKDYASLDAVWGSMQQITQGYPQYFTMWGFPPTLQVYLYPVPSTAGTLNVFYYRLPADLATDGTGDATAVDIPQGWWDLAAQYCEYVALRKDRNPVWQESKAIYEENLNHMID